LFLSFPLGALLSDCAALGFDQSEQPVTVSQLTLDMEGMTMRARFFGTDKRVCSMIIHLVTTV